MAKQFFTPDEIKEYLKEKTYHYFYKETKEICESMSVHADGKFATKLITERRPNEPQDVLDYRKKIFEAKTKPTFTKIFSSLQKIRRSSDWSIRYEGEFSRIADGETLEDYCEMNYPGFNSITNWVFSVMLRKYLIDPNAVVFVHPGDRNIAENEYLKPVANIFESCHVVDFEENDFAVLLLPMGCTYYVRDKPFKGKTYFFVTTTSIVRYDQIDGKMNFDVTDNYQHDFGSLPVFKLKGLLIEQAMNQCLYESRISGIIPELNEAIREYSDLQAAKVLHIYPERWEYTNHECTSCKGKGLRHNPAWTSDCNCPAEITCDTCYGRGYVVAGPYSKIMIKPANTAMGEQPVPTPPAGYVEKDVEIVKIMEESIERHIYNALSSINFEFLSKTPLSESGIAKEVDKDELNNNVHSIAEDIVSVMDNIYRFIARYRYGQLYPADIIEDEMVPVIAVPEKFDILSSSHMQEELKVAKESNMNPLIRSALEIDYTGKRFIAEPEIRDRLTLILLLDPLPNVSEDEKMSRLSNKGVTLEAYIISSNIQSFVQRAIEENKGFVDMEPDKQRDVLAGYAHEVITANEPVVDPDAGLDDYGFSMNEPDA